MQPLLALLGLVVIVTPILAIVAFIRVQRLSQQVDSSLLPQLTSRIYSLEQQLARIEKTLASARASEPSPAPTPVPAPTAAPPEQVPQKPSPVVPPSPPQPLQQPRPAQIAPPPSYPPHPTQPTSAKPSPDLEALIAGRWFNRIGILMLIIVVSLSLKYAFDNNWVGASGRVGIGLLLGAAMLPWSQWLLSKGYVYFSEGIAALGQATLLLSIWAGCRYYSLFSLNIGFAAMIVVTVVMAAIALARDSQRIALLSLFGGFLTPVLLSTGRDAEITLFTYLLILGAGLLILDARRDWRSLIPVSFAFTQIYFWGWYETFYRPAKLEPTIIFATLFFLLYLTLPVLRVLTQGSFDAIGMFVLLANSFAYLGALYAMLWPQDRWPLTLLVLALSAGHIAVAHFIPAPEGEARAATHPGEQPGGWPVSQQLFAGLALTFATLAIPIRLEGKWITLALAVEGAILVWTGFRSLAKLLRNAGFLLLALAALRVVFIPLPAQQFIFNERFGTYVGMILCMGAALFSARERQSSINDSEKLTLGIFAVAINFYALIALSLEFWDYFSHVTSLGIDRGLAQHLALSVLWTVYASVLIAIGIKRQSALLRWQALVLFGLVVIKVFVYDSSYLIRFYRILSFLILGIALLIVSFLYQSKTSRGRASS
jgi:uncharacterized membrane protein